MKRYLHERVHQKAYHCALISEAVYDERCLAEAGLKRASDSQAKHLFGQDYQKLFMNCPAGFRGRIYHDTHDDSFVFAFRGTTGLSDLIANAKQYLGAESAHYEKAKEVALSYTGREKLYFTGHSLGGGLATVAAIMSGLEAYVYNPVRINKKTIAGLSWDEKQICRYVVKNEYLDYWGTFNKPFRIWTEEIGKKNLLHVPIVWKKRYPLSWIFTNTLRLRNHIEKVILPIQEMKRLHGMETVLEGLRNGR
jgi:hypothetical protein